MTKMLRIRSAQCLQDYNTKHKKNKGKICAEIAYKAVFNSFKIVGLIFSKF